LKLQSIECFMGSFLATQKPSFPPFSPISLAWEMLINIKGWFNLKYLVNLANIFILSLFFLLVLYIASLSFFTTPLYLCCSKYSFSKFYGIKRIKQKQSFHWNRFLQLFSVKIIYSLSIYVASFTSLVFLIN